MAIPLKHFVSHVDVPPVPRQIRELALEQMSSSTQSRGTDIEQLAQDFARHCTEVQKQLQDLGAKVLPNAVACRPSGKAHRVANALSTLCGLPHDEVEPGDASGLRPLILSRSVEDLRFSRSEAEIGRRCIDTKS